MGKQRRVLVPQGNLDMALHAMYLSEYAILALRAEADGLRAELKTEKDGAAGLAARLDVAVEYARDNRYRWNAHDRHCAVKNLGYVVSNAQWEATPCTCRLGRILGENSSSTEATGEEVAATAGQSEG